MSLQKRSTLNPDNMASGQKASHAWHDLSVGKEAPEIVHAVVEIPAKSKVKYELDKETGTSRYLQL